MKLFETLIFNDFHKASNKLTQQTFGYLKLNRLAH